MAFHEQSAKQLALQFKTNLKKGLTPKEAKERVVKFGPNKLPEEKPLPSLKIFFQQFQGPLIYVLLFAAVISFILREFIDTGVILAAVVLNTIVGFFQENKAEKTVAHLRKMVEHKAKVLRGGEKIEIDSSQVVPSDILILEEGDKVAADSRLFEAKNLSCNEAALTGESMPSPKIIKILPKDTPLADRENMVFAGTTVASGRGGAIVVATGEASELGKIAQMVKETKEEKTPLQLQLASFSRLLGLVIAALCFLILTLGVFQGRSFFSMFTTAVAIAVAAIPEGLPVALTVILAIGMQRILTQKALVKKLIAAETLGSTTVICSDKTATLTEGKMKVAYILTASRKLTHNGQKFLHPVELDSEESHILALKIGLLCNNATIENPQDELSEWRILGDPIEKAILLAATQAGLDKKVLEEEAPRIDEIPFDHKEKFMATLHRSLRSGSGQALHKPQTTNHKPQTILYVKGAPEKILAMSLFIDIDGKKEKLTPRKIADLTKTFEELTSQGLRVLAVAYKKTPATDFRLPITDLAFVGLIALKDPLRPEAKETIAQCLKAEIRPIIVTGDHKLTAGAIGSEVGLRAGKENILEGQDLDKTSDETLSKRVDKIDIYARVEPKHKLRIIDALQKKGEVVAMIGDGVNDAPALKSADIGVALGSGTDVAKETADIVLLDDNFKTIVLAVEQGRVIFENIKKVVLYLLSSSFTEVILVGASLLFGWPLPLLPAQILWVNLVEDGLPTSALAFEPEEKEVMDEPARKKETPILDLEMKVLIFIIGIATDFVLLGLFWYWLKTSGNLLHTQTMVFVGLGIDSLFYVFSCRSLRKSILQKNPFSNKFLVGAVILGFLLLLSALYLPFLQGILRTVPLSLFDWGVLLGLGFFEIFAIEAGKWFFIAKHHRA